MIIAVNENAIYLLFVVYHSTFVPLKELFFKGGVENVKKKPTLEKSTKHIWSIIKGIWKNSNENSSMKLIMRTTITR